MNTAEDWIPTRQSLLSRLRDWDDAASWQDFFDTYSHLLYRVARKSGLSDAEAQEAVQETVINVARQMPRFRYDRSRGSFKGWLLRTLQWRISDQFRRRKPHVPLEVADGDGLPGGPNGGDGLAGPAEAVAAHWDRMWTEHLLEVALERVRRRADPREFQVFDLVVGKEWAPLQVARKLQLSRARVYYVRSKVAAMVQKEVRSLEKEWGAGH